MGDPSVSHVLFFTLDDALTTKDNRHALHQLANIVTIGFIDHVQSGNHDLACGVINPFQPLNFSRNLEEFRNSVATSIPHVAANDIPRRPSDVIQFLQNEIENFGQGYIYHFWVFSDLAPQRLVEILRPLNSYRSLVIVVQPSGSALPINFPSVHFYQGEPDPGTFSHSREASYIHLVSKIFDKFYQPYPILFRFGQLIQEAGISFVPGCVNQIDVVDIIGFSPISLSHNVVFTSSHRLLSSTMDSSCLLKALLFNLQSESLFAVVRVSSNNKMGLVQYTKDGKLILGILHPDFPLPGPWHRDCHVVLKSGLTPLTSNSLWKSKSHLYHLWAHHPSKLIRRLYRYIYNLTDQFSLLAATVKALNQAHNIYSLEKVVLTVINFLDQEISSHPSESIESQKLQIVRKLLCLDPESANNSRLILPDRSSIIPPVDLSSWIHSYQLRNKSALIIQIKPIQETEPESLTIPSTPILAQVVTDTTCPTGVEENPSQIEETTIDSKFVPSTVILDSTIRPALNNFSTTLELEKTYPVIDLPGGPIETLKPSRIVDFHTASAPETVRNSPPPQIHRSQSLVPADTLDEISADTALPPNTTGTAILITTHSSTTSDSEPPLAQLYPSIIISNESESQLDETSQGPDLKESVEKIEEESAQNVASADEMIPPSDSLDSQVIVPMESESEPSDSDIPIKAPLARITKPKQIDSEADDSSATPKRKLRQRSKPILTSKNETDTESQDSSDSEEWNSGKIKLRRIKSPTVSSKNILAPQANSKKSSYTTRSSTASRSKTVLKIDPSPRKRVSNSKTNSGRKLSVATNNTSSSNTMHAQVSSCSGGSLSSSSTFDHGLDIDDSSTTTSEELTRTRLSRQSESKNGSNKASKNIKPSDSIVKKVINTRPSRFKNSKTEPSKSYLATTSKRNSVADSLSSTSSNDEDSLNISINKETRPPSAPLRKDPIDSSINQPEVNNAPKLEIPEPPILPNKFAHNSPLEDSKEVAAASSITDDLSGPVATVNSDTQPLSEVNQQPNTKKITLNKLKYKPSESLTVESQLVTGFPSTKAPSIELDHPETKVALNDESLDKEKITEHETTLSVPTSDPQNSTIDSSQGELNGTKSKKGKPKKNAKAKTIPEKDDKAPVKRKASAKTKEKKHDQMDETEQPSKRKYNRKKNVKGTPPPELNTNIKSSDLTSIPADSNRGDSPVPSSEAGSTQTSQRAPVTDSNTQFSLTELTKMRFNSLFSRQPKKSNSGLSTSRPPTTNLSSNQVVNHVDGSTEVPPQQLLPHTSILHSEPMEFYSGATASFNNSKPEPITNVVPNSNPLLNQTIPNNPRQKRMYNYVPIEERHAPNLTGAGIAYDNTGERTTEVLNPTATQHILPQNSVTNLLSDVAPLSNITPHPPLLPHPVIAFETFPNNIPPNSTLNPVPDVVGSNPKKKPKTRKKTSKKALQAEETQEDTSQETIPLPKPKPRKTRAPKKANKVDKGAPLARIPEDLSVPPPVITSSIPEATIITKEPSSAIKVSAKQLMLQHSSILSKDLDDKPLYPTVSQTKNILDAGSSSAYPNSSVNLTYAPDPTWDKNQASSIMASNESSFLQNSKPEETIPHSSRIQGRSNQDSQINNQNRVNPMDGFASILQQPSISSIAHESSKSFIHPGLANSQPLLYYTQEEVEPPDPKPKVLRHKTLISPSSSHPHSILANPPVYSHQSYSGIDAKLHDSASDQNAANFNPPSNPVILSHSSILSSANKPHHLTNSNEFYDSHVVPNKVHPSQISSYDSPYPILIQSNAVNSQMNSSSGKPFSDHSIHAIIDHPNSQPYPRSSNSYRESRGIGSHSILNSNILNSTPHEEKDSLPRQFNTIIDNLSTPSNEEEKEDTTRKSSLRHLLN